MKPSKIRDQIQKRCPWLFPLEFGSHLQCRYCGYSQQLMSVDGAIVIRSQHRRTIDAVQKPACWPGCPVEDGDVDITDLTGPIQITIPAQANTLPLSFPIERLPDES